MFNSAVTSSWANPQQNQQQQQPSAFGQPASAFGAPSAFGSAGTGAFGQAQPAQQPQANPMFGNLSAPAPATNTGFGAFGATNTSQSNTANPMFGGAKPSTGFGAFGGGTSAFGGGGAFGQSNTASGSGTGAFGQPTTTATTSAFGGGGGNPMFGANKPTTGFVSALTTPGAQPATAAVTTGSSNPPYAVHTDKDPANPNTILQYQSISCMPAYAGTSAEELRWQDYNQGRKTASSFGPGAFGTTQPAATTGLFGAQPAQQTSAFGAAAPATNAGTFGAFGTPATNAPTTSAFGGGAFGQPQQQQQQQPQQQTGAFGAFGSTAQPQQQQTGGGLFGGGAFGSATSKPAFGTGAFGSTPAATGGAFGGGGAFGQPAQQTQQPAGGIFGTNTAAAAPATGFGGFGNNTNTGTKSIFGQPSTQPATGFGAFGQNQQQQPQQPQQANPLFGGTSTGTGLFGQQQQNQQQPGAQQPTANPLFGGAQTNTGTTGGLFGGGGLFGATSQQPQQAAATTQPAQTGAFGTAFGVKPAQTTGPLFGGGAFGQPTNTTQQPTNPLFGTSTLQPNNQSTFGASFIKPATPAPLGTAMSTGGGLFGSTNQTGGLFNTTVTAPGAQGTLTASISEPIGNDLPIFKVLPPGPRLYDLEPKKKAGFFVDVPTRSPMPRVGYTPANSKLRGFGSSSSSPAPSPAPFASSVSLSSSKNLSFSQTANSSSGFDAFLSGRSSSPALGSGSRQSVKKVILDKKIEPTELFTKSGGSPGRGGKVVFSPALSTASRQKDAEAALHPNPLTESPTPAPRPKQTPNRFTAQSQQPVEEDGQGREFEEGEYYVKPDLTILKQKGYDELSSFKDLVVGRVGFGEIHFMEPVDLTGLPKLGALLGEVIRFDEKECSVYPESDDVDKPPPGSGLNVRARLTLVNCWAVDKATREPITDDKHPSAVKHLKRLKKIPNTHFESFDIADGKWTFTLATHEDIEGHAAASRRGAVEGAIASGIVALGGSYYAQRRFAGYRSLPLSLKCLGVVIVVAPCLSIQAERRGLEFDKSKWEGEGVRFLHGRQMEEEARWEEMSTKDKLADWADRHQYSIILGGWASSLAFAGAIISRDRQIVQARMWAQGLTIGILIVAGALTQAKRAAAAKHPNTDHSWRAMLEHQEQEARELEALKQEVTPPSRRIPAGAGAA
ncbi:hypothetical protein H0H92_007122 [Tricholoma furcatifolium]|nr:hypothetical protein H0H92_007122 [Tricholoma furcatifolium]